LYLKRLEIQGFKSFAGRSVFEFGPGITAIVGPNGSGKSNLADALRWVLGEQNPRTMRSRKSEEVIFAGGRQRPPAGFAEVSMALDNTDGWLPVQFGEVVFTRRVHRSGESEYLVNRAKVRLKDMIDLLSRARVGQNSYAIMGQGLVDQVLNLHPEERRALIEEAADVRRHRVKIQDAVDRLAATRDNLDRVDLLVGEIAPRLAQLEEQARTAAQYELLTGELGAALHRQFTLQWRERNGALIEARALYEQRTNSFVAAQSEIEQIERDLAAVRVELQQEREAAAGREAALRDVDDRMRGSEQRLQLLQERAAMAVRRLEEIAAEIDFLSFERQELGQIAGEDTVDGDAVTLPAEEDLAVDLRSAEQSHERAMRALSEAEEGLRLVRGQVNAAEDGIGRLQRGLRAIERERDESAGRRNTMLARLRKGGRDILEIVTALQEVEQELSSRSSDQGSVRRQAQAGRDSAEHAGAAVRAVAQELEAARARLELLGRLRDQHQGSDAGIRALVEAARRAGADGHPRLLAVLSQVIRVQKGLEVAVEAALEDQLGAVIVPESTDVEAAVRVLVDRDAGRVTIVPLKQLRPVHAVNLNSERGVLGVAARFVKCEARYRDVVDTLLGRVIVVEDLAAAQAMLRRGLGTAVTLDGTVVRPTGIVSAGSARSGALALEYARDLEELPGQIAALRAAHEAQQREAGRTRELADAAESRLRGVESRLDTLNARRRQLQSEADAVRSRIAAQRSEAAALRGNGSTFDQRRAQLESELAGSEEERRRLALAVRSAQLTVEERRRQTEELHAPVNALRARMAAAEGARQAMVQHRAALNRLRQARQAAIERTDRALAARQAETETRSAELAAIATETRELESSLAELRGDVAALRGVLQPLREQVADRATRERQLYDQYASRRSELLALERGAMEAESAVNRRAQAIDRLREEMEAEGVEIGDAAALAGAGEPVRQYRQAVDGEPANGPDSGGLTAGGNVAGVAELQARVRTLRGRIRQLGPINSQAGADYHESRERHEFLTSQVSDLQTAERSLQEALEELRHIVRDRFRETFQAVNADFVRYFKTFFGGGAARLALTEPEDYSESGVDVLAQPPGKRQQHLQLLSGGERSMAAVALLFALLQTNPAPFCMLDEVDAALDEANVNRFGDALQELAIRTQFVLITHNRATLQAANTIYGVSMGGDGVSTVLSLRLEDVPAST